VSLDLEAAVFFVMMVIRGDVGDSCLNFPHRDWKERLFELNAERFVIQTENVPTFAIKLSPCMSYARSIQKAEAITEG
jgi:hypothetical protein